MYKKKNSLTQIQINQLVTDRFVEEMKDWDDFDDVFIPINTTFNLNIKSLNEFKSLPSQVDTSTYAEVLDSILDNIASQDAFGTEQQCDPRGDFRNYQWSMWNVEV